MGLLAVSKLGLSGHLWRTASLRDMTCVIFICICELSSVAHEDFSALRHNMGDLHGFCVLLNVAREDFTTTMDESNKCWQ